MVASELISDLILPLRTSDTGSIALTWMDELRVSHLPIVNNESFLGLISEKDIMDMNEPDESLGNHFLSLARPYVLHSQHLFDAVRVASEMQLTLVPVLDEQHRYLGCITQGRLLEEMAQVGSVNQPGGIIVLEVNIADYSMHEIARIVESNDAKVLSCHSRTFDESTKVEVTLKINKIDASAVIQTFNRYDYFITASFSEENDFNDLLRERFGSLMNYLSI
jgi:acetoin utilization protein AcuB